MNYTNKTIAQGALVITLTAGGVFYSTSDSMTPAENGCIQYTTVDGSTKQLCGESASMALNTAHSQKLAELKRNQPDTEPTSTASLPSNKASLCHKKKNAGQQLGTFCKLTLALDTKP